MSGSIQFHMKHIREEKWEENQYFLYLNQQHVTDTLIN